MISDFLRNRFGRSGRVAFVVVAVVWVALNFRNRGSRGFNDDAGFPFTYDFSTDAHAYGAGFAQERDRILHLPLLADAAIGAVLAVVAGLVTKRLTPANGAEANSALFPPP